MILTAGQTRSLLDEINGMLGLGVRATDNSSVDELAASLEAAIDADATRDPGATRELVAMLSTDQRTAGYIHDLAEISFLPRRARSEYVNNRLASPPWVISKLLLEFATRSWRLDALTGGLNKDVCARACERLPVGCCSVLGYDLGLVPAAMLTAQRIEARRIGWTEPARETKCRYHGDAGCVLKLFKSPACVGYLCAVIEQDLARRYPAAELRAFLEAWQRFRNCDIDRHEIFTVMDAAIVAGLRLVRATEDVAFCAQFDTI